jgi:hypothetical protein
VGCPRDAAIGQPVVWQPDVDGFAAGQLVAAAHVFEIGLHHAYDSERRVGEEDGFADDVRVAAEDSLPDAVADDCDVRGAGVGFLLVRESFAHQRLNAEEFEEAVGNANAGETLGALAAVLLILADVGGDVLKTLFCLR